MKNTVAKIKESVKRFFHSTKGKIITVLSLIFGGWFLYRKGFNDGQEPKALLAAWHNSMGLGSVSLGEDEAGEEIKFGFFTNATKEVIELKETIKALTKEVNGNGNETA